MERPAVMGRCPGCVPMDVPILRRCVPRESWKRYDEPTDEQAERPLQKRRLGSADDLKREVGKSRK